MHDVVDSIYNAAQKGDVETDGPDGPFSWVNPGRLTTNDKLKTDWENENGEDWPIDPETGKDMIPSHEIPLADGGPDHVSNIKPRPKSEHDKLHKDRGDPARWGKRGQRGRTPRDPNNPTGGGATIDLSPDDFG